MKTVFIYTKQYKKELLISHKEVDVLQSFLKNTINNEVLIISTNFGIEVYYLTTFNCTNIIVNSFLIIASKKNKKLKDYKIISVEDSKELIQKTEYAFGKLLLTPVTFSSYSKSVCNQLNNKFEENKKLIKQLFIIWQEVLFLLENDNMSLRKILFLEKLQDLYLENNYNSFLRNLLKSSMSSVSYN